MLKILCGPKLRQITFPSKSFYNKICVIKIATYNVIDILSLYVR